MTRSSASRLWGRLALERGLELKEGAITGWRGLGTGVVEECSERLLYTDAREWRVPRLVRLVSDAGKCCVFVS
jgi:hypothetical protein